MTQTELKTYLQVLKARVKASPYKEVEITGDEIKVRGSKESDQNLYVLHCGTKGDGIYSPEALDLLMLDVEADLSAYRKGDAMGWTKDAVWKCSDTTLIYKELMGYLNEAAKYVSKDELRPALTRIHFSGGDIFATDGYKCFLQRTGYAAVEGNLSPNTVAIVKKCYKYGTWSIAFGHTKMYNSVQKVSNGTLDIWDYGTDTSTTPKMRELLEGRDLNTTKVISVPYTQIKSIAGKETDLYFDIDQEYQGDGEMLEIRLGSMILPLRAAMKDLSATPSGDTYRILMPRVPEGHYLSIDLALLKAFPTTSEGNIMIQLGDPSNMLLIA